MIRPGFPNAPTCPRCGQKSVLDWAEATTFGDEHPVYIPASPPICPTDGCVNELGARDVLEPSPEQLWARLDAMRDRRARDMLRDLPPPDPGAPERR